MFIVVIQWDVWVCIWFDNFTKYTIIFTTAHAIHELYVIHVPTKLQITIIVKSNGRPYWRVITWNTVVPIVCNSIRLLELDKTNWFDTSMFL